MDTNKSITAQVIVPYAQYVNKQTNMAAFFNMIEKLQAFCEKQQIVLKRRSPIRFEVYCPQRRVLKRIMSELAPEETQLGLQYHIPQNRRKERLSREMLDYLETM